METYNYLESVTTDVRNYIDEDYLNDGVYDFTDFNDFDDLRETLYDDMFVSDSVTGNASGSYTFSTYTAEENLCHNLELYFDALQEFGYTPNDFENFSAEGADVTIRCYLLSQVLHNVLDEIESEGNYKFGE